jgi:beta-glucosidase
VHYDEGLKVGYKWYDAENKPVLFPFGYGLSYTTYQYSDLKVAAGKEPTVTFTVKNAGARAGAEIAEVYVALPASAAEPPGESREVSLPINPRELSIYDEATNGWKVLPGAYTFMVGGSSKDLPLHQEINLP